MQDLSLYTSSPDELICMQLAQKALQESALPEEYNLNGLWQHTVVEMEEGIDLFVELHFSIVGAAHGVIAYCSAQKEGDEWSWGSCIIAFDDHSNTESFEYDIVGGQLFHTSPSA